MFIISGFISKIIVWYSFILKQIVLVGNDIKFVNAL